MSDLWTGRREAARRRVEPLAWRMRPRTLDEVAGQRHILGEGCLLPRMLKAGTLSSLILHGPPGTGKTTLAEVIARHVKANFVRENAASVGVARIREIIQDSARRIEEGAGRTILFLDEIHRFSKSQQDVLLGDVERGVIILIGATTENPMFAVNSALVSRSTVFRLEPLSEDEIETVVRRAITDEERGFGKLKLKVDDDAIAHWARLSDGDARRALTALEVAVLSRKEGIEGGEGNKGSRDQGIKEGKGIEASRGPGIKAGGAGAGAGAKHVKNRPHSSLDASMPRSLDASINDASLDGAALHISLLDAQESIQHKALVYSGDGDEHYDVISAMIKSIRGSDPDAAVYWMARMIEAGEDPRFIARRLAILASEDIGNADPQAVVIAQACWSLVERIGMPEARITLGQCATYLALAPKSNAAYMAIERALADVRDGRTIPVPMFLRDPHKVDSVGSAKEGAGYEYSHSRGAETSLGGVTGQDYLGVDKTYYEPTMRGFEKMMKERLGEVRKARGRDER